MRFALALLALPLCAAEPAVSKLDPPSWWPAHSINPIRVLIRGSGLAGARLVSTSPEIGVKPVRVNEAGTYIFADFSISRSATPGQKSIRVITAGGETEAQFEVLAPLPRAGRFQGFSPADVIYLLMPDRFANGDPANDDPPSSRGLFDRTKPRSYHGGDLRGVIARLPYLKSLGVTAIWMNPVYDNVNHPNRKETYEGQAITDYHGYGAVDFYAVDEHLGAVSLLRELVDKAHQHGIKVILDMVANHTGPYHPWVSDPPTPAWYNGAESRHLANTWQTWTLQDPYSTEAMRKATLEGWFIDILPDLNQNEPECARYLIQNTLWWVGMTGIDGIRQDTLPYVPRAFWRDWMAAIKRQYPKLRVVGELFDGDPALLSFFQGGVARYDGIDTGIDALFDFPLFYSVRGAFAQGKGLRAVPMMLARDHLYPNPEMLVTFLGLHDVQRFMNESGATVDGLKLAFTFLMTARGIPLIYYGDEIAMRGGNDPDNRRDFPVQAFEAAGRTPEQEAVWQHVRALAQIRREHDALRGGSLTNICSAEESWVYMRTSARAVVVALNNSSQAAELACPTNLPAGTLKPLMGDVRAAVESGVLRVTLPPRSAAVYEAPPATPSRTKRRTRSATSRGAL